MHGLRALRDTLQQDKELNMNNCSVGIVGKDIPFHLVSGETLQGYLDKLAEGETGSAPAAATTEAAPMETDA